MDISFLNNTHFSLSKPIDYSTKWECAIPERSGGLLREDCFVEKDTLSSEQSWSSEIEELHEEPTKDGWIDSYERKRVFAELSAVFLSDVLKSRKLRIVEFGASSGYMVSTLKEKFPMHEYIATDLIPDGLSKSYQQHQSIMHIQCDFTDSPFADASIDVIYALNVLEHITDDVKALKECYRNLRKGGYCLIVVPRGDKLYDYFDEMLFHKRRYARGELLHKAVEVGFQVEKDFHYAWVCYPFFWLKKKWNRFKGKGMSQSEKLKRVQSDISQATSSTLAVRLMKVEQRISTHFCPPFGVREFVLLRK